MEIISEKWQNRWSTNEVIVLVLVSLGMQIGLIFLAPLRKRSTNPVLKLTLWLLYLTADSVAMLALGYISYQADPAESDSGTMPGKLTVLWAPFLLLHLGGPDSITSYSLEDNELWWRHLLGLVVQIVSTVYVFWQSPPMGWMWIPTMLVFIPGLIKCAERTHALRLGSKDNLRDKFLSDVRTANKTKKGSNDNTTSNPVAANGTAKVELSESEKESQAICEGYAWFNVFKCLLVDVSFSPNVLMQSQDHLSEKSASDALNLVAIELSFLYDILHTKAFHMHNNLGRVLRCFSLVSIIAALVVFHHLNLQKYASKDIIITYILFGAGLILEVIAAVLLVSSDWTVVSLRKKKWRNCIARAITSMVKGITFQKGKSRWSRNIGQFNLVGLCLRDRYTPNTWIMKKLIKIKHKWDNLRESRSIPLLPGMFEDFLFTEAKRRALNVHIYNVLVEAGSYRGGKALERYGQLKNLEWTLKREIDESITIWHVATDICYYNNEPSNQPNGENEEPSNQPIGENNEPFNQPNGRKGPSSQPNGKIDTERDVSWKTSNYMAYLLTQQQPMMQLGYGKTRFEATCSVVKKIFKNQRIKDREARQELQKWRTRPEYRSMGDEDKIGKCILSDSCRLAEELNKLDQNIRWKLISETWMEMLGDAAIHSDSYQHAKSVRRGGELLTHLWLLMAQLGVVQAHKMHQS